MRARGWWAALAYVAVLGALAIPWLAAAGDSVPRGEPLSFPDDARLLVWVVGWVAHALVHDPGRLLDANIHYPLRHQLTGSEHLASTQVLAVPLVWLTGNPVLAANVVVFLSYPAGALAMWWLLVTLGCSSLVAWIGGLCFVLGAFRVPANLQLLQYLNVHLPLAVVMLERLRRDPRAGRAIVLAIVLTAGFTSSYYMATMVGVAAATYVLVAIAGDAPRRGRFVVLAVAAGLAATAVLVVVSLPYFGRPEARLGTGVGSLETLPLRTLPGVLVLSSTHFFGVIPALAALVGLTALATRDAKLRRLAVAGLALTVVGFVLLVEPPPLLALLRASPLRFLRAQLRFSVLAGFGTAMLAGAGLERLRAWLPRRMGDAALVAVVVLEIAVRGLSLAGERDRIAAASTDRAVYDAVGAAVGAAGVGPLLELPIADANAREHGNELPRGNLESEAMVGSLRHWCPLLTGHSAYPPAHRALLELLIGRLPRADAVQEIVDLTGVRWLLLRPRDYWAVPAVRDGILRVPGVTEVVAQDGWTLARVDLTSRHPEWIAALADGPRAGRTLLGTPLAALEAGDAVGVLAAPEPLPAAVAAGATIPVFLSLTNAGPQAWPVLVPPGVGPGLTVHPVARWRPVDSAPATTQTLAVRRDVMPGETIDAPIRVTAPPAPGTYDLEIGVVQDGGASFDAPGNAPVRGRVVVGPPTDGKNAARPRS